MISSSMTTDPELEEKIRDVLRRKLKMDALAFHQMKGGRNSRVFRVDCANGTAVAVKAYFRSARDRRDRMGCESRALQLLQEQGLRKTAKPLLADNENHVAVYEFIEGRPVFSTEASFADIDQVLDFLRALKQIAASGVASVFPAASEACFSIDALFANLDRRLQGLERAAEDAPALGEFLSRELNPFRKTAEEWCRDFCRERGIEPAKEISLAARTLSPSDFGFHNTLRRPAGELAFLDFEYFGWDDPAKTISDFVLHPGMQLPLDLRQHFFSGALAVFSETPKIEARVRAVYPLFGLKWCTILLNEFTLDHGARRSFAVGASGVWSQTAQLEKARALLGQATHDYRNFPYHL
jgi:Phosphotransferase enzyme family